MSRIGGHRWRKIVREILAESDICWLCGQPGADSGDLELVKANTRPAHLICNQRRGTAPVGVPRRIRTSRAW